MTKQRKLAAVMFTDIAGYTTLMSKDEHKALALLRKNRDLQQSLAQKYNGEFLKEMGDGTLLCFQSALDAVRCAMEIQQSVKDDAELNLRIGIHLGDIVFKDGDVFGDGVNVASRIEGLADVGGICISGQVFKTIRTKPDIEAVYLGEKHLKNVEHPVKIYALIGEGLPEPSELPRQTKPESQTKKRFVLKIVLPIGIVILCTTAFFLLRPIFYKDALSSAPISVAVMPFENETGDESNDRLRRMIPNLFISKLEQSRYLQVTTWERMRDLLKQLDKSDMEVEEIDNDTGFELCALDGVGAVIIGSVSKLGNRLAIEVKVLDVSSKRILKSAIEYGESQESIFSMIDMLGKKISHEIGLSETKMQSIQQPVIDVTTTSIDSYNYFLRGRAENEKLRFEEAKKFLMRATELDSTFAMAYLWLGRTFSRLNNTPAMGDAFQKAKAYSQNTTEKEKMYIEAIHATYVERNQGKALHTYKEMLKKYPKEKRVYYNLSEYNSNINKTGLLKKALTIDPNYGLAINRLAYIYSAKGEFDEALKYLQQYSLVAPGDPNPHDSMADLFFYTGKLDEAITKYKEAMDVDTEWNSRLKIAYIYALQEDYHSSMKFIEQYIDIIHSPGKKAEGFLLKGLVHCMLGSYTESIDALKEAQDLFKKIGHKSLLAFSDQTMGWIFYEKRDIKSSRRILERTMNFWILNNPRYPNYYKSQHDIVLGVILFEEEQIDSALIRLNRAKSYLPLVEYNKEILQYYCQVLEGMILLKKHNVNEAISIFKERSPISKPNLSLITQIVGYNVPFLRDMLGNAFNQAGEIDKAISGYERITRFNPDSQDRLLIHPKYYYRLAKLYEEKGLKDKAIERYGKFLDFWKDADDDLPEPHDARTRLARLSGES